MTAAESWGTQNLIWENWKMFSAVITTTFRYSMLFKCQTILGRYLEEKISQIGQPVQML